jgi:uncharacterized cupredoxin-like copper-binding protein
MVLQTLTAGVLLFLSACGTSAPAQPAASEAAPSVESTNAQPSAAPDVTSPAPASGTPTEVDITLADNTIQSSLSTFKVGVPYRFVIINNGNHLHNFNISAPVADAGSMAAALSSALLVVKQDQLPVGGGTTVEYTFPASAVGKPLEFSCLIRRHYEDGMRLAITVTQ